jgi:UDP-N-acetyl-D-mannosaminuronate dehydrogenase
VPDASLAGIGERLVTTSSYKDLESCHAAIVCVPTPLTSSREPDL